jgi:hypothetical protein
VTTREEIDAKLAASEARAETRFVELTHKIEMIGVSISSLSSSINDSIRHGLALGDKDIESLRAAVDRTNDEVQRGREETRTARQWVIGTTIATVAAGVAVIVTVWALARDEFGRGLQTRDVAQAVIRESEEAWSKRLSEIQKSIEALRPPAPSLQPNPRQAR